MWGTMAADVDRLGHNASTDVVGFVTCGLLDREISYQTHAHRPWRPGSKPSSQQPPRRIGLFFAAADSGHHGVMMRGGGGDAEGGTGARGEVFCLMEFLASIDHGGRCHPTAARMPHSQCESIQ